MRIDIDLPALTYEVENQGGALLPDPCVGDPVRFPSPPEQVAHLHGCGHESRFVVTYEAKKAEVARGGGFATVCAYADRVDQWPRFAA